MIGGDEDFPVVVSILTKSKKDDLNCICRTKFNISVSKIDIGQLKKEKLLNCIQETLSGEIKNFPLVEVKETEIESHLENMEDRMLIKHYSFGVLYCKSGQKTEEEFFSNKEEEASQSYHDFLNFLGDKVKLEGFLGPKVGLDTKSMIFLFNFQY